MGYDKRMSYRGTLSNMVFLLLAGTLLGAVLFGLWGCAAGRLEQTGDVVVGLRVGSIPETAGQLAGAAIGLIPGLGAFGPLVTGAATLLLGGGAVAVGHKVASNARDKTDANFDEGVARGSALAPTSAGVPTGVANNNPVVQIPSTPPTPSA